MSDDSFLPYFINETLYVLKDEKISSIDSTHSEDSDVQEYMALKKTTDTAPTQEVPKKEEALPTHYGFIVVSEEFSDQSLQLLEKVLSALKITLDQIQQMNTSPQKDVSFDRMLVFGDSTVSKYEVLKNEAGAVMYCASLQVLATDRDEKLLLWNALKSWFGL
ncbi:MAG: DNA polymerase III psi subunit [Cyclobacteriaceae bacterium]|jgi:DNA polymerase III psi subunit